MRKQRHTSYFNCPMEAALDLIGGKWKAVVLYRLYEETRRFSDLQRLLPNITQRVLTNQLRELEQDGLILRTVYNQVPLKVEYSLTEFGQTLVPVLESLMAWGKAYALDKVNARVDELRREERSQAGQPEQQA